MIQFKRLFKLGEKEVLKLVEYDEDIITAPQWVPIWRFWSQLGLFTVFGPHFYRLKSLISPYYMLFGKIQFRNDLLTMIFFIKFNSKNDSFSSFQPNSIREVFKKLRREKLRPKNTTGGWGWGGSAMTKRHNCSHKK